MRQLVNCLPDIRAVLAPSWPLFRAALERRLVVGSNGGVRRFGKRSRTHRRSCPSFSKRQGTLHMVMYGRIEVVVTTPRSWRPGSWHSGEVIIIHWYWNGHEFR